MDWTAIGTILGVLVPMVGYTLYRLHAIEDKLSSQGERLARVEGILTGSSGLKVVGKEE